MVKYYKNFDLKKFLLTSSLICFLGDALICTYIWVRFSDKEILNQSLKLITAGVQNHPQYNSIVADPSFVAELYTLALNVTLTIIVGIIGLHSIVYLAHFKRVKLAYNYVRTISWFGAVGSMLIFLTSLQSINIGLLFLPMALLYFFAANGFKLFPLSES